MLIYDDKLLQTTRINQLVLPIWEGEGADKDGNPTGYIYTDLETYRQALTLHIRFDGSQEALSGMLMLVDSHKEEIDYFTKYAPEPFKLFAPYIGMIHSNVSIPVNMKSICDVLHVLSMSISFSEFIIIPKDARVNITYTKTMFLLMDSAIAQQKMSLLDRSKYDDIADWYVSNKDFELMGKCLNTISDTLGSLGSRIGVGEPYMSGTVAIEVPQQAVQIDESGLDIGLDLSEDWGDFVIPQFQTEKDKITSSVVQVSGSVSTVPIHTDNISHGGEELDLIDKIVNGTVKTSIIF